MKKQPKIDVPKTIFAKIFDWLTCLLFLGVVIYLLTQYSFLPNRVPGHFDQTGTVDRWGRKIEIWILPLVGTGLWILMTIIERYPHTFNYVNLREDNIELQYKNAKLMMNVLKNESVLLFSFITYQSIRVAIGTAEGLESFFLPLFLFVIVGSMVIFLIKMFRL